jgi:nucleotide-binding universal stress UspA family protein
MGFSHVLVTTDLSDAANHALRYAIEEATLHHARMTILHVLPENAGTEVYYVADGPGAGVSQEPVDPSGGGPLRSFALSPPRVVRHDPGDVARTQMQDLVRGQFEGPCEVEVATGHPADAIVRVAQERGVDLIVMGTHGRTGLQHVFLGSVAEKVVRLAPCPVLTVRHPRAATKA